MFFPLLIREDYMRAAPGWYQKMEFPGALHEQIMLDNISKIKEIGDTVPKTAVDSKSLKYCKIYLLTLQALVTIQHLYLQVPFGIIFFYLVFTS